MSLMTLTGSDELNQFYNKKFYFSYSSINKLLFSPRAFYSHYVLNQREDSTDAHLVTGRVLHCLLLEEQNYDKYFITMASKIPGESSKKIIDMMNELVCSPLFLLLLLFLFPVPSDPRTAFYWIGNSRSTWPWMVANE